jgi:hypothetical protein
MSEETLISRAYIIAEIYYAIANYFQPKYQLSNVLAKVLKQSNYDTDCFGSCFDTTEFSFYCSIFHDEFEELAGAQPEFLQHHVVGNFNKYVCLPPHNIYFEKLCLDKFLAACLEKKMFFVFFMAQMNECLLLFVQKAFGINFAEETAASYFEIDQTNYMLIDDHYQNIYKGNKAENKYRDEIHVNLFDILRKFTQNGFTFHIFLLSASAVPFYK